MITLTTLKNQIKMRLIRDSIKMNSLEDSNKMTVKYSKRINVGEFQHNKS